MSFIVKGMNIPELYETYKVNLAMTDDGKIVIGMCPLNETGYRPVGEIVALPEHHGRLVDADALEKILEKIPAADIKNMGGQAYVLVKLSQVFNVIDNQPTIEPRKKGKWLPDNNSVYEMRFVCSECKESQVVPTIGFTKYKPIWDFCPNCGADMREPEDIPMEYFESGGR